MEPVVLVVDDNPDVRSTLADLLEYEGFDVVCAEDGVQAIRALEGQPVALIITDLNMPVMDGQELVVWVRNHPTLSGMPIIVVSARPLSSAAVGPGGLPFLSKPVGSAVLLRVIESLLAGGVDRSHDPAERSVEPAAAAVSSLLSSRDASSRRGNLRTNVAPPPDDDVTEPSPPWAPAISRTM